MDQMGVSVAGARDDLLLSDYPPRASLWTTGARVHWSDAALANRYAGDDLELTAGPEVGAAGVATAELVDASLGELDAAIAVACDVEEYLRGWLQLGAEAHGLHPPALLGAMSAAAVSARLLGLDRERFAGALAAAAALAPVSPYAAFSRGASGKRLYGAWSQMLGARCASAARYGIAGPATVLEGARGIAQALLDAPGPLLPPRFDPDGRAVERVTFKAYPCSRACHAALTAIAALGPLDAEAVDIVDVWSYPFSVELDRRALGDGPIAAQMSLTRTVALFLVLGELRYDELGTAPVRELAERVRLHEIPEPPTGPRIRRARVRLMLRNGSVLESEAEAKWSASCPATEEEIRLRFLELTAGRCAPDPWSHPEETKLSWLASRSNR
jgi:2-methylcitrate dehydratase PrpD